MQHPVITQMVPGVFARPPLASNTVRFVGDIVAIVVAESPVIAADAADQVVVELAELPVVMDPERASAPDAPILFPDLGSNVVYTLLHEAGDPLERASDDKRAS